MISGTGRSTTFDYSSLPQGLFFKATPGGKVLRDSRRDCRDDP